MISKLKFSIAVLVLIFSLAAPALAEGGGEGGGNQQDPVQVIVQIAITAIILRILSIFKLP
jgi:hypothetical protein